MRYNTTFVVAKRRVRYLAGLGVILLLLTTGCGTTLELKPLCRNYVEFQDLTIKDQTDLQTRVAYGWRENTRLENFQERLWSTEPSVPEFARHVQLQVYHEGEWRWVVQYPYRMMFNFGPKDLGFEPDEYGSMEEAKKKGWIK
jgi:hypothetical protein